MYDGEDPYAAYDEEPVYDDAQPVYDDAPPVYDDEQPTYEQPEDGPEIISTSQGVNLTSALASLSAFWALFLCFADQRSRAIRHFSVQSVGLCAIHVCVLFACLLLGMLLGWLPIVGGLIRTLLWILVMAVTAGVVVLRLRLMFHAYRGEEYSLPIIGGALKRFE